jgi:hypothetical protein
LSGFATALKGYGTRSYDLGAGASETLFYRGSISDTAEALLSEKAGKLFSGRDVGVFVEEGFTLDNQSKPQYRIEGVGLDLELGNTRTGNADFNEKITLGGQFDTPLGIQVGGEREVANAIIGSRAKPENIGIFGDVAFGMLNRFLFK